MTIEPFESLGWLDTFGLTSEESSRCSTRFIGHPFEARAAGIGATRSRRTLGIGRAYATHPPRPGVPYASVASALSHLAEHLVRRIHDPGWAWVPGGGKGTNLRGGRFNPHRTEVLYMSMRPETALLEAQQGFAFKAADDALRLASPPRGRAPCLTSRTPPRSSSTVPCPSPTLPSAVSPVLSWWTVAGRLAEAGVTAVLVPSFAPGTVAKRDVNALS